MKVGIDTFSLHPLKLGAFDCLEHIAELGFAGVQLGSVSEVSRELDQGVLREYRARADELGLYSLGGVGAPNPHIGGKAPDELVAAITRQIEAAANCGWHELRTVLGGPKERYELDVDWPQQLADSADVLRQVLPVLRHHGSRIDLENHGETTSFEVVRLAEELGPDAIGVCLDTANLLIFAEDPVAAARRVAPYTHLTHAKDAILYFYEGGLKRQGRPPGQGCIDWPAILPILAEHSPALPLSIEDHKWIFTADIFRDDWLEQQPDLTRDELARTVGIAWECQDKINRGEWPHPDDYEAVPYADEMECRLESGREHLAALLTRLGLAT